MAGVETSVKGLGQGVASLGGDMLTLCAAFLSGQGVASLGGDMLTLCAAFLYGVSNILQGQGVVLLGGDMLTLCAAFLYGVSNLLQEDLARNLGWQKVLANLGQRVLANLGQVTSPPPLRDGWLAGAVIAGVQCLLFECEATVAGAVIGGVQCLLLESAGAVIAGGQCLLLESEAVASYRWEALDIGLVAIFVVSLFLLYSLVPKVLLGSGATFLNLNLLTADFWAVLFGVTVLENTLSAMYGVTFVLTISRTCEYRGS
ncbi:hypothetical protein T484DRAFT_1783677 [Baffinella frigidus]|nr:hypothetical protein T484DRAFT_1783677 [Cryptophyta sp. CCMP2293]